MASKTYKKRPGTSGIRGQLYESKLISLIHFRAKHNINIESFSLATNVDNIGIFDDICLRFKTKTFDKPFVVFVQAKHRENDILLKNDLDTYFESYLKVKQAFKPANKDLIFKGQYDEVECFFVLFTTARGDCNYKSFENGFAGTLDDMIGTAHSSQQMIAKNKDVECLHKVIVKEQITKLAKPIAKLFFDEITDLQMLMNDEFVLSYHVILAQKFCDVSDVQQGGYRLARVRQDFFDTDDEFLVIFRRSFYKELIEKRKVEESELKALVTMFIDKPSDVTILSKLIGCAISYKNGKLEFVNIKTINDDLKRRLSQVHVPSGILDNAIEIAGREIISAKQILFKVPVVFGNKDLIINKDERLKYLESKIIDLFAKANRNNVITIDDTIDKGLLKLNGGLAGTVGNLLVFDEKSKMLMFNENIQELGDIAKRMLTKLKENTTFDLSKYRFYVKVKTFPKLTFECSDHDKNMAKDFFERLLFYTSQADENRTGKILREEIEKHRSNQVSKNSFLSQLIFLKYHDAIQHWWMSPNISDYLTEKNNIFENAMKTVVSEPPMTVMNRLYEIKTKEADLTFNDKVMDSLEINTEPGYNIVITESIALTLYKLKQYFQNKEHDVIDLEYSLKLLPHEYETLLNELQNSKNDNILIVLVDIILKTDNNSYKKIEKLAKIIKSKLAVIITRNELQKSVLEIFSEALNVVNDDKTNLTDLCEDTQHRILQKKMVFQGQEIKLKSIIDEVSKTYVKGDVLCKIVHNETIIIGEALQTTSTRTVRNMYIGRRVCRNKKRDLPVVRIQAEDDTLIRLKRLHYETCTPRIEEAKSSNNSPNEQQQESIHIDTLHDLDDDVIVLTTKPGAGKTTFFDHLILQTKKIDQTMWIVSTKLFDYSKEFSRWRNNKTDIDILECLKFMSLVILGNREGVEFALQKINNDIHLEYCTGDELSIFELKLFLHFYNRKKMVFLFDGFDEVYYFFSNQVLALIRTLKEYPILKHKIWITSRPYLHLKQLLEDEFEASYDLDNFSWVEQNMFLFLFWITNEILNNHEQQLENIYDFIIFLSENPTFDSFLKKPELSELIKMPIIIIYINFICFLKVELKSSPPRIANALTALYDKCYSFITLQNDFVTNPLDLSLLAEFFLNDIISPKLKPVKIEDQRLFHELDMVFDQIRKVHAQQTISLHDVLEPDALRALQKRTHFRTKKFEMLGAYAVFNEYKDTIFCEEELKHIKDQIETSNDGDFYRHYCYDVVNGHPTFKNSLTAEILAVEYVCNVLKGKQLYIKNESICEFMVNLVNVNSTVKLLFDGFLQKDSELKNITENLKKK